MTVNWQLYAFEDALETAVQGWLCKNGINDPAKQRDALPEGETLAVPRVEVKSMFGGFGQREHYYVRSDGARWVDLVDGTLYLKIVTSREPGEVTHAMLRGQCRGLMQFATEISALMPLHQVEKIIEQSTATNIDAERKYDVSSLSFSFTLRIRSSAFPTL